MSAKILMAIGLVCVLEGLTYALVPAQLKKMMESLLAVSNDHMRVIGTVVLAVGVGLVALAGLL
jgi:uncharacterized protein